MSLHRRRVHPTFVEGCPGCRFGTLQFAVAPTNDVQAREHAYQTGFAREFENGDRPAYVALRRQGYQPMRIAGCAELEARATTRFEIESGQIHDPKVLRDALQVCDDAGFSPLAPSTTPKAEAG